MSLHPLVLFLSSNDLTLPPPLIASSLLKILDSSSLTFFFTLLVTKINIGNIQNTKQNAEILKILKKLKILERDGKFIKLSDTIENAICVKEWNKWIGSEIENIKKMEIDNNKAVDITKVTNTEMLNIDNRETKHVFFDDKSNKNEMYIAEYKKAPKKYTMESPKHTNYEYFEDILNLIVNKKGDFPCKNVRKILLEAEIIDHHLEITNKGFEFLLKTRTGQLWELLFTVFKICESNKNDMIEILLELSLLKEGFYTIKRNENHFYAYLEKLGLIDLYQVQLNEEKNVESVKGYNYEEYIKNCKKTDDENNNVAQNNNEYDKNIKTMVLRINHLFTLLFTQEERVVLDFLIIESNFRVYLKTKLLYHRSIMALFTQTIHCLPNFVVSIITEESLSRAFDKGITSNQLYKYLRSIAQKIPENVIEQIFIWQEKRNRIKTNQCVMFSGFLSITDFRKTVDFCKNKVDYNEEKRMLFVNEEDVEDVKKYIKTNQM
ncbi:RNA polymerase II transcription factor B 52 kDa subunit [Binucleata daphniae]